jgi:hypothetical protein
MILPEQVHGHPHIRGVFVKEAKLVNLFRTRLRSALQ